MISKKYTSLSQVQQELSQGKTTCVALADYYLQRCEEYDHLNAYLEVFGEEVREQAALVDQKLAEGTAGRLAGIVSSYKRQHLLFGPQGIGFF